MRHLGGWWVICGALLVGAGCASTAPAAPTEETTMTKRPLPETTWTAGPALSPAADLATWLRSPERDGQIVKLPVVVRFQDDHRLAWDAVWIGARGPDVPDDAIRLDPDDTALGVGLLDTLQSRCPKDRRWCAIWLEGTHGYLVPTPRAREATGLPFTIRRIGDLISDPASVTHALVPAPR